MANFEDGLKLTNKGRDIPSEGPGGAALTFTRMALGDGNEPADFNPLTTIVAEKESLTLTSVTAIGSGQAKVKATLSNENIGVGFYLREIGLYATDPDDEIEYLYAYTHCGAEGDYLPAGGGATVVEQEINLITVVGSATNLVALVDASAIYATQSELNDLLAQFNAMAQVSIEGPGLIYPGSSNAYTITDHSDFSSYAVEATVGTVSITATPITLDIAAGETESRHRADRHTRRRPRDL